MTTTIITADDHPVVRMGLRTLLQREPGLEIVAEAADGIEAVKLVREHAPDVLVLDLMMPGRNGMEVIDEVRRCSSATRIIVLSMHSDSSYVTEALHRGAQGYVVKDSLVDQIAHAIRTVMAGSRFCADGAPAAPVRASDADRRSRSLTAREQEILRHIAQGESNKEIADGLAISVRTVETHRARIMHKLDLKSHAALIHFATRNHLKPPA